jgi:hypothetical protein
MLAGTQLQAHEFGEAGVETLAGALQRGLALVDLGKHLVDPRYDPPPLSYRCQSAVFTHQNRTISAIPVAPIG